MFSWDFDEIGGLEQFERAEDWRLAARTRACANLTDAKREEVASGVKAAMRRLPSGVALVTTRSSQTDEPVGMAVSSVVSLSLSPPSMLVALNRSTTTHAALKATDRFCISLLNQKDRELVLAFSTSSRRDERFRFPGWKQKHGLDHLEGAASLFCETAGSLVVGTHELFIGEVFDVIAAEGEDPLGWMGGSFQRMVPG